MLPSFRPTPTPAGREEADIARLSGHPLVRPLSFPSITTLLVLAILIAVFLWSLDGSRLSIGALIDGWPGMQDFFSRTWPPDWSVASRGIGPLLETLQMAIVGTLLAVVFAIPLSLLAASNISPNPVVYQVMRAILNVGRTIPELILALIFVAAVGLGPFPGTMALALGATFSLSKLFAEAIEQINPRQVEAVGSVGGTKIQTIAFGVLPQAFPLMVSYTLLYWEGNIRAATILGAVGAGGIGFLITTSMSLFRYRETITYVIMLVVLVTIIDRFSAWLRRKYT